jgi:hypothetical protein
VNLNPQLASWLPMIVLSPLIAFGLYRRFKTSFGRQRLVRPRMLLRMGLLTFACALLLAAPARGTGELIAAAAGLAVGVAAAAVGLRWTKYESSSEGVFYVPNGWIGVAVTALFLGRLAARLLEMPARVADAQRGGSPAAAMQSSPLTLGLFFLLAGYYVSYYAGVLTKARTLSADR